MKFLNGIYSAYLLLVFVFWFLFVFPFLLIPIIDKKRFRWVGIVNRIWANLIFRSVFFKVKISYEEPLDRNQRYIFCPNHFSYLDIPTVGMVKNANVVFVGKSALEKIPLFGWMYKKLHITVDRSSLKSKYNTMVSCMEAIDEGKSLVVFPEGGILAKNPPHMARFKEGAFRVAVEKNIPLVPVTIYNNWRILGEDILLHRKPLEVKFHKPINIVDKSTNDIPALKEEVFNVIQSTLNSRFENKTDGTNI